MQLQAQLLVRKLQAMQHEGAAGLQTKAAAAAALHCSYP
jgi:hypothetical protein